MLTFNERKQKPSKGLPPDQGVRSGLGPTLQFNIV